MKSKVKKIIALVLAVLFIVPMATSVVGCKSKTFTVTFNAGKYEGIAKLAEGFDESVLVQTVSSAAELIEPRFVCEGEYHNGWNKVLRDIKEDTTVSAVWYPSSFSVKLNPNAQDVKLCSDTTCKFCHDKQVVNSVLNIEFPKNHWVRDGYTLSWGNVEQIEVPTGKNPSITIDAIWTPNTYKVSFVDSDGVTKIADDISVKYDSQIGELPSLPNKGDKVFGGWLVNGSSTIIYSTSVYKFASDIVLCAVWLEKEEYLITYVNAGEVNNIHAYKTSEEDIYLNDPKMKGYEFTGWTGDGIENNENGYFIPAGTSGALVLTANWKAKTYNIQFNAVGGSSVSSVKQFTYGMPVGELPTATKDGYKFEGWMLNSMPITSEYIWDIDDSSVQIVAKYLRYYTVEYHLNYTLYESTKYETVVPSKILNESTALANGFIKKSDTVYYKENVLEGSILGEDDFFDYEPLDKQEYYKSKWKARKFNGTKYVKYNVIPGMIVSEQSFPGTYESGVIVLYSAVGAYWTPGYV